MKSEIICATMILMLFFVSISVVSATPHRMILDYTVGRIDLEVYFDDGSPGRFVNITVRDPEGSIYITGRTDERGSFSFEPDRRGVWTVIAEDQVSHRAETTIDFKEQVGGEMPLYARVIAGIGYLVGLAGVAIGYMGWRTKRGQKRV